MNILFDGKCKLCKRPMSFVLNLNSPNEISFAARCPHCGNGIDSGDKERIYHLMDSLESFYQLNGLLSVSRLSLLEKE